MKNHYDNTNYFNRMAELQDELNSTIQSEKVMREFESINEILDEERILNNLEDVTNKPIERKVRTILDDKKWKKIAGVEKKKRKKVEKMLFITFRKLSTHDFTSVLQSGVFHQFL
jgi:hypothetical protein